MTFRTVRRARDAGTPRRRDTLGMPDTTELAGELARLAEEHGFTVGVAESLTGGKIACELGAAPDSSTWFRGSLVAYAPDVKFEVLGVPPGPVVTEECARAMADGVAKLLAADLAVAVTGVGGPDEEEGHPPGTVWFSVVSPRDRHAELRQFDGEPEDILEATTQHALRLLLDAAPRGR
jgi:nicotinamide-nucleotide amidase